MQCVLEAVQQEGPVGEPGQLVVEGPFLELRGHLYALGDVAGVHDHAGHRGIAKQIGGDYLHVAPAPFGMRYAGLEGGRHAGSGDHLVGPLYQLAEVVGMDELGHRDALHGMGLPAEDAGHRRAGIEDPAVLADHAHQVRGVLHQGGKAHLGGLDPLLGGVEVGQVAGHHRDGVDRSLGIAVGDEYSRDGHGPAVAHEAELAPPRATGSDRRQRCRGVLGLRPGIQHVQEPNLGRGGSGPGMAMHGVVGPDDELAGGVQDGHGIGAGLQHPGQLVRPPRLVGLVGHVGDGEQSAGRPVHPVEWDRREVQPPDGTVGVEQAEPTP